ASEIAAVSDGQVVPVGWQTCIPEGPGQEKDNACQRGDRRAPQHVLAAFAKYRAYPSCPESSAEDRTASCVKDSRLAQPGGASQNSTVATGPAACNLELPRPKA